MQKLFVRFVNIKIGFWNDISYKKLFKLQGKSNNNREKNT